MPSEETHELSYPRVWTFALLGEDEARMRAAVDELLRERVRTLRLSHESRAGKYRSLHLELEVASEDERNCIFGELKEHESIRYVL